VTPLIATVAAPTHRHRECSKTDFFNGIEHQATAMGRTQPEDHLGRNDRKRRKRSRDFLLYILNTHQNKAMQEDK
jgi:hypothetical protein